KKVPWAKFSTRRTPKMSESPDAIRKRNMAAVRPERLCAKTNDGSGIGTARAGRRAPGALAGVGPTDRERPRAPSCRTGALVHERRRVYVHRRLHDRERVLRVPGGSAVELAAVGLMVLLADRQPADGRLDGEAEERVGDLVGVGAVGLLDRLDQKLHADVALDG